MRLNTLQQHGKRIWLGLLCAGVLSSLLLVLFVGRINSSSTVAASPGAPEPFQQPQRPWTAIGSTGVVDEASVGLFGTAGSSIGFKPNVAGNTLVARYNVTNTFDNNANPNQPGWKTLEMGSNAPNSVIIEATLFEVNACAPAQKVVCKAVNRSNDRPCSTCPIISPVDFTKNLYYVEVKFDRTGAPAALPRVFTLRIY